MSNDNNVKHYRKIKKLTQEDIAKLLYIDRSVYAKKEKGKVNFTIEEVFILEKVLEVSIYDLFKPIQDKVK